MKDLYRFIKTHKIHLAALIAAGLFVGWIGSVILISPLETSKEIVIKEGQGVSAIADALKTEGIIDNKFVFIVYAIISGNEEKLQAGRYIFGPGMTIPVIARSIAEGYAESDDVVVTIPEGFNVFDIDKRLASSGLIEAGEFARKYYADEGQFFPDTYRLRNTQQPTPNNQQLEGELKEKAIDNFNIKTSELLGGLSAEAQRVVIILASILEKEARREEDMRLVAGVIENRLEREMLLQIDATVSYGVCLMELEKFKNLKVSEYKYCDVSQVPIGTEIKIDGPYNTYTRAGLPPGPIANPGITAIQAVLNPTKNGYLYYLSTRDGSQVIFSKTAAEHAANRRKYLGL